MKVLKNVMSNHCPKQVELDANHVYLNTDIKQVSVEDMMHEEGAELQPMYSYTVTEYDKDEFLVSLSNGQISLDSRATMIEDMILEMSEIVYA